MNSKEFLELLMHESDHGAPPVSPEGHIGRRAMRREQAGEGWVESSHDEVVAELGLSEGSVSVMLTSWINALHMPALLGALSREAREKLENVPVGVISCAALNAHALKAPDSSNLIVINSGLITILGEFAEFQMAQAGLPREMGAQIQDIFFEFLVHIFYASDNLSSAYVGTPAEIYRLKSRARLSPLQMSLQWAPALAGEMFVLAHEICHVAAGHLDRAETLRSAVETPDGEQIDLISYQQEWEHEFEADMLGYQLTLAAWRKFDYRQALFGDGPLHPLEYIYPLYFFDVLALIEANSPTPDKLGTHPPAVQRWERLLGHAFREMGLEPGFMQHMQTESEAREAFTDDQLMLIRILSTYIPAFSEAASWTIKGR